MTIYKEEFRFFNKWAYESGIRLVKGFMSEDFIKRNRPDIKNKKSVNGTVISIDKSSLSNHFQHIALIKVDGVDGVVGDLVAVAFNPDGWQVSLGSVVRVFVSTAPFSEFNEKRVISERTVVVAPLAPLGVVRFFGEGDTVTVVFLDGTTVAKKVDTRFINSSADFCASDFPTVDHYRSFMGQSFAGW